MYEAPACPENVWPNNDTGWLAREPTNDEVEVVAWIKRHRLPERILHVGIGNSLLSREFGDRVVQGLTRDGGEATHAKQAGLETLVCNKYDVTSYEHLLERNIDCIVDVNIRSYACCDAHFLAYMDVMRTALSPGGYLLTSRSGLDYRVPHFPEGAAQSFPSLGRTRCRKCGEDAAPK